MIGKDELEDPGPPKSLPTSVDTTLHDLTDRCYDAFERLVEAGAFSELNEDEVSATKPRDLLGLKNSFAFWVDYTGSLAPVGASLDDRLVDYIEIKEMIFELLEMVERNVCQLERICAKAPPKGPEWDQSMSSIGAALDRLHFLASAIRKASTKKVFKEEILLSFATDEEIIFKNTAVAYVKWKFPKARKSLREYLGSTIAFRQKILLKRHSHEKYLATRRAEGNFLSSAVEPLDQSMKSQRPAQLKGIPRVIIKQYESQNRPGDVTEATQASKLDGSLVMKYIHQNKPSLSIRSSGTSRRGDSLLQRYPSIPKVAPGERYVHCPYCRKPLRAGELRGSQAIEFWERHIDSDLQPYVCLFPQCLGEFFTHRSDWARHMKTAHGTNWPRKMHCATWFCDIGHTEIVEFDNEIDWKAHMRDVKLHPDRKNEPTNLQLQGLAVRKRQLALRDELVCPLCEEIPVKISSLGGKSDGNNLSTILENHIAGDIKDLSFLSLPSLDDKLKDEVDNTSVSSESSQRRLLNTNSISQAPSRFEFMENVSLTFTDHQAPYSTPVILDSPDQFRSALQRLPDLSPAEQRHGTQHWIATYDYSNKNYGRVNSKTPRSLSGGISDSDSSSPILLPQEWIIVSPEPKSGKQSQAKSQVKSVIFRSQSQIRRDDNILRSNDQSDFPSERYLSNLNTLISMTTNVLELEELKKLGQKQEVLFNRLAALRSPSPPNSSKSVSVYREEDIQPGRNYNMDVRLRARRERTQSS
ncbi:hypothetical protein F4680DRAFT_85128 [Xylaria scruposa]|nr:hypothetical protein F4680DRAFT_85128 [Xylaria scruposa]